MKKHSVECFFCLATLLWIQFVLCTPISQDTSHGQGMPKCFLQPGHPTKEKSP